MRTLALVAALGLAVAAPAAAQSNGSSLTLQNAANAPARVIIDSASWSCEGATCVASGGAEQPATRACRRVVARLGAVTEFTWKGVTLSAEQLAACNAAA